VLALSAVVVLSSAAPSDALGHGHRPALPRSTKVGSSAAGRLRALQAELAQFDQPIRMVTAVWLAMQARVKRAQARVQHDRRQLRDGPGRVSARRLRADIRHTERRIAPLLPTWIRVKAMLKRAFEGVKATLLETARGTPIVAALPGVARRVPNTLGGNAVIVDSAGGTYTYYPHLSAYGASGAVAAGAVIGYAGASGDARGLIPHLHFELHPRGGDAVDAFPDLQAVC